LFILVEGRFPSHFDDEQNAKSFREYRLQDYLTFNSDVFVLSRRLNMLKGDIFPNKWKLFFQTFGKARITGIEYHEYIGLAMWRINVVF